MCLFSTRLDFGTRHVTIQDLLDRLDHDRVVMATALQKCYSDTEAMENMLLDLLTVDTVGQWFALSPQNKKVPRSHPEMNERLNE